MKVILIEPEHAGNVGAVARVMKNFGFKELVLVDPKVDHLCEEARNRAKHAQEVLESAVVCSFDEIDVDYLVGTTALLGTDYNIPRSPLSPKELKEVISGKEAKIGLLFGRESSGLTNEEVSECDFIVTIPANSEYPTLNLSHSVAVMLYELSGYETEGYAPLVKEEKDEMVRKFDWVLDKLEFATPEKKETQQTVWKRIVGKSFMTKREGYVVMGFLKKLIEKL